MNKVCLQNGTLALQLKDLEKNNELPNENVTSASFLDALKFWFKLGFISFGGPAGQISIMHETVVDKKKWISEEKFLNALNYCMLLPGPEAQQLATYIGWLLHGVKGGLVAGIFFILPGALLLLLLSILYVEFHQVPIVFQFFYGLKISVAGIVLVATRNMALKSLRSKGKIIIACLSFLYIFIFQLPMPFLIFFLLTFGIVFPNLDQKFIKSTIIQNNSKTPFKLQYLTKLSSIFLVIGVLPYLFFITLDNGNFWKHLIEFFLKTSLITFGGAYAVLPYVAEQTVHNFHWLESYQMIDGLALGETTPGPLVIVLSFVGFMAGFKVFAGNLLLASVSMAVATYYTFLPSFYFIFAGAPFIESLLHLERLKRAMGFVSAGIVGLIASLACTILITVSFESVDNLLKWESVDYFALIWIAITFYALTIKKWNMIFWIIISSLMGWTFLYLKMILN